MNAEIAIEPQANQANQANPKAEAPTWALLRPPPTSSGSGGGTGTGGGVLWRPMVIEDFESLVMAEMPYGKVDPSHMRKGIVERIGLGFGSAGTNRADLPAVDTKFGQVLQWQFGAKMCAVVAAMRFEYQYTSPGYAQPTLASLLIGYAAPGGDEPADMARRLQEAKDGGLLRIACSFDPDANAAALKAFLQQNSPYSGDEYSGSKPRYVELCGLARDNDSMNALPYTWSEVAADPAKLDQLLYWPFGGTSHRICKAMRIYYGEDANLPPSLLIGYHGPGGT